MSTHARVAITAAEARTALGRDLDTTWKAVLDGASAVGPVQGFDASGFGNPHAAQIWSEPATSEDDPALRILGRHGQLLESVLLGVHDHAHVDGIPRERVGMYVSIGMADTPIEHLTPAVLASRDEEGRLDMRRFFGGGYRHVHPLWPLAILNNVAAGQISIDLDIRGDNVVTSSESDGAVRALIEAACALADGTADAMLTGGVSEPVCPAVLARLGLRGVLGDGPAMPCSAEGRGCSPGEGAAAFLLQREIALGTRWPLAFLCGGATVFGPATDRPGPDIDTLCRALEGTLAATEVEKGEIDTVFLHAEGRADQDADEVEAVTNVLGDDVRLVATKGALGHTGSAAPAIDLALAVRALTNGRLPPSVTRKPLVAGAAGRLRAEATQTRLRRVLILAASSQGSAGGLVVEAAH